MTPEQLPLVPPPFEAYARRTDPATSHEAAEAIKPKLTTLEGRMLLLLRRHGTQGLTSLEMSELYGLPRVTVSPQFRRMARKGVVLDSGQVRRGSTGRNGIVWIAIPTPPPTGGIDTTAAEGRVAR